MRHVNEFVSKMLAKTVTAVRYKKWRWHVRVCAFIGVALGGASSVF